MGQNGQRLGPLVLVQITPPRVRKKTDAGNIKATHKPTCLLEFLNRSTEDCLYIDADVVIVDRVELSEFDTADIAVTARHPNEMRSVDPYLNGKVNSGVIFLRNSNAVRNFVASWIEHGYPVGCRTDRWPWYGPPGVTPGFEVGLKNL